MRLICADEKNVWFTYKDYADGARLRTMTLGITEFVRRFALHVLPERFVKIRHYGLLGNRQRQQRVARARLLLGCQPPSPPEPEPQSSFQEDLFASTADEPADRPASRGKRHDQLQRRIPDGFHQDALP